MPEITFNFDRNIGEVKDMKILNNILEKFFKNNDLEIALKSVIFEIYKKRINYYIQRQKYTEKYISNLDKSIKLYLQILF